MNVWMIIAASYAALIVVHWIILKIFKIMEEKEIQGLAILYLVLSIFTLSYTIGKVFELKMDSRLEENHLNEAMKIVLKNDFNIEFASEEDYENFIVWCSRNIELDGEIDLKGVIEEVMSRELLIADEEGKYHFN